MSTEPFDVPCIMFQNHSVPVLVLEWGWFDHGYGAGRAGADFACLADMGHVVEPRVISGDRLFTVNESVTYYTHLAEQADAAASDAKAHAVRLRRDAERISRYWLGHDVASFPAADPRR